MTLRAFICKCWINTSSATKKRKKGGAAAGVSEKMRASHRSPRWLEPIQPGWWHWRRSVSDSVNLSWTSSNMRCRRIMTGLFWTGLNTKKYRRKKKTVVKLDLKEHSSSSRQIYARTLYWLMPILCSAGSGYLAYHTYIFVAFMAYDFSVIKNIKKKFPANSKQCSSNKCTQRNLGKKTCKKRRSTPLMSLH